VLDPGVVVRIDAGAALPGASMAVRGADAVARQALTGLSSGLRVARLHPVLVNGAAGMVISVRGRPRTVMGFTIVNGKIAEIDAIGDPDRVRAITADLFTDE
jgi:RNA polymerase sigma-70 factor (ECF subfamily)